MSRRYTTVAKKALTVLCALSLLLGQVPTAALAEAIEEMASEQLEQTEEQPVLEQEQEDQSVLEQEQEAVADWSDDVDKTTSDADKADEKVLDNVVDEESDATKSEELESLEAESEDFAAESAITESVLEEDKAAQEIKLVEQKLTATVYADATMTSTPDELAGAVVLEGMLPEGAKVVAWPVEHVNVEDFELLTAYEIQILIAEQTDQVVQNAQDEQAVSNKQESQKWQEWQPENASEIVVSIDDEATRKVGQDYLDALVVYHIHDNETDCLAIDEADASSVSFATDSFSTFALGATRGDSNIPVLDKDQKVDGVTYYLDTNAKTAGVQGLVSPATIHYQVKYGNTIYTVTNLGCNKNGSAIDAQSLYKNKTVYLDDELAMAMYGGAGFSLPSLDASLTADEAALVADYESGNANDNTDTVQKLWKKAEYNAETGQVDISLAYFQKMVNTTLDFIFVYDMSDTMWCGRSTMNGFTASRAVWSSAALQLMAKSLLEQGEYNVNVKLIPFNGSAKTDCGWLSDYNQVKDYLASSWTEGCTDHGEAATAAANAAYGSSNTPVIVYISDIVSHAGLHAYGTAVVDGKTVTGYRELTDMRSSVNDRVYLLKIFNGTSKEKAKDWTGSSDKVQIANDVDAFVSGLQEIVKESVGYYIDADTVVNDEISTGLMNIQKGITLPSGSSEGSVSRSNRTVTWTLNNGGSRLKAGELYTKTFSVDVNNNVLVSGSLPTNGSCQVVANGNVANEVGSPVLGKDFTMVVRCNTTNDLIDGAEFELINRAGTKLWTGTSVNGSLTIPYSEVKFPANGSYTLRQLATDDTHLLPTGTWALNVGSDYQITVSTVHGEGYNTSKPNAHPDWTVDASVENGSLLIKNRTFTTLTIKNRVNGEKSAEGQPIFLISDATVNGSTVMGANSMPAYVLSESEYVLLPTYVQQSADTMGGKIFVRSAEALEIMVPDQAKDVAYSVQGALLENSKGQYEAVEGRFTVLLSDSSTEASIVSLEGNTSIENSNQHVTGDMSSLTLSGTLPVAGAVIELGGKVVYPNPPAPTGVEMHDTPTYIFALGSLAVGAMALCFARRKHEDEEA